MSAGASDTDEESVDRVLTKRLLSFQELLGALRKDVEGVRLTSHCQPALDFIKRVLDVLVDEVAVTADEIIYIAKDEDKFRRSRILLDHLEEFVHFVHTVVMGSRNLPRAIFQLVEMIEGGLPPNWGFGFLIWNYPELATLNVNGHLARTLQPFANTRQFIEGEPICWAFAIPRSVLDEPLNWPLVSHEVAHVLEQTQVHAVETVYGPRPPRTADPYDPKVLRFRHGEEYQADFIAAYMFGPCFLMRVMSSYFTQEIHMSATHPAWPERIRALLDVGIPRLPAGAAYKTLVETSLKGIPLPAGIVAYEKIDLPTILDTTVGLLQGKIDWLDCDSASFSRARDRLSRYLPYTEDYRCLLNAAVLDEKGAMATYRQLELGAPGTEETEYRFLVMDCVRLCYVGMHYQRRVSIEHDLNEDAEDRARSNPEPAA